MKKFSSKYFSNFALPLLKPKSIEELKKIYYERYQEEIEEEDLDKEELDYTITNTFSFIFGQDRFLLD